MQKIKRAKTIKSFSDLVIKQEDLKIDLIQSEDNMCLYTKASIAYKASLFVSGWYNESIFRLLIQNKNSDLNEAFINKYSISLLKNNNNEYIACGIIDKEERSISIFVKKTERGHNYGSKIIEKTLKEARLTTDDVYAQYGISGSSTFYAKNNIITFRTLRDILYFEKNKIKHIYLNKTLMQEYIKEEIKQMKSKDPQFNTSITEILDTIPSSSLTKPMVNHLLTNNSDNKNTKISL